MADATTIQTRITEAETARHDIATGMLRSWMANGRTYTLQSISALDSYIETLKQELATAQGADADQYGFVPVRIEGVR
jgi:hypothetical protein